MSKKTNYQQHVLSIGTLALFLAVSTLFYFIDDKFNGGNEPPESNIIYTGDYNISEQKPKVEQGKETDYLSEIKDLHDSLTAEVNETSLVSINEINVSEDSNVTIKKTEYEPVVPDENKITESIEPKGSVKDPKLVIIIDDIAFQYQIDMFKKLNLHITLSMFPSDSNHPMTNKYAKNEKVPMVHLPLQAVSFSDEEIDTLHVTDSDSQIAERVAEIAQQFPNAKYINNHTGSKFTADRRSMYALLSAMKKYNIQFVDSVTSSRTVVRKISSELGLKYIRRDVFLDNELNVGSVTKQLKTAINIAKKNGFAIAIGHPHKVTVQAISKIGPLLNGVRLVYINEL